MLYLWFERVSLMIRMTNCESVVAIHVNAMKMLFVGLSELMDALSTISYFIYTLECNTYANDNLQV